MVCGSEKTSIPRSETSGTYSSYPTYMETCILFFLISAILTVFSPTPFPIDEESVKYIKIEMRPSSDR